MEAKTNQLVMGVFWLKNRLTVGLVSRFIGRGSKSADTFFLCPVLTHVVKKSSMRSKKRKKCDVTTWNEWKKQKNYESPNKND